MIVDRVKNLPRYFNFHPLLEPIWAFLSKPNWKELPDGKYTLIEDQLFVILENCQGKGQQGATLEAHQRYFDLQMCIKGTDLLGWRALDSCEQIKKTYDPTRDIVFFEDRPEVWIPIHEEQFAIVSPEDAHAPLGCEGSVRKLIFKFAVQ